MATSPNFHNVSRPVDLKPRLWSSREIQLGLRASSLIHSPMLGRSSQAVIRTDIVQYAAHAGVFSGLLAAGRVAHGAGAWVPADISHMAEWNASIAIFFRSIRRHAWPG